MPTTTSPTDPCKPSSISSSQALMNWCGQLRIQLHVCSRNHHDHFISNWHLKKEVAHSYLNKITKIREMFIFFLLLVDMTCPCCHYQSVKVQRKMHLNSYLPLVPCCSRVVSIWLQKLWSASVAGTAGWLHDDTQIRWRQLPWWSLLQNFSRAMDQTHRRVKKIFGSVLRSFLLIAL